MIIFTMISTGIIQRLLIRYSEKRSLVITNHPMVDTTMVEKSITKDVLSDFLTYCLVKKSPSAAIDMKARGGIYSKL
ncbi:MAG: hypothetical protein XD93_0273 [candidate division WS6 bacterium 34_10]|uniref:Uncharacterized protein n=1 Tax=candidate division WS6 bacterium 34_10 TaxID=1641389 RepID=A0A117M0E2_9BACT|nr:MAG: hypothetical protein XD93_0273 [candidate division WS6 bacterium 34_10]